MTKKNDDKKANDAIKLLRNLVVACRYVAPKSNDLNKAYHDAKDFLSEFPPKIVNDEKE